MDEARDDWGPTVATTTRGDIPYQPYSKSERIGRISDWTLTTAGGGAAGGPAGGFQRRAYGSSATGEAASALFFKHEEEAEDDTFHLVDPHAGAKTSRRRAVAIQQRHGRSFAPRGGYRGSGGAPGSDATSAPFRASSRSAFASHRWGWGDSRPMPRQVKKKTSIFFLNFPRPSRSRLTPDSAEFLHPDR